MYLIVLNANPNQEHVNLQKHKTLLFFLLFMHE